MLAAAMELRHLRYLVAVAEQENISRAVGAAWLEEGLTAEAELFLRCARGAMAGDNG
jgi:hypothetical protein